jgi:hypothetical protein
VIIASVRCRIAAAFVALVFTQLAHAELSRLYPLQILEPDGTDVSNDPNEMPSPPMFGSGLAVRGNVALAGMPAAWLDTGRVAAFVRDANGNWIRRQTLTASNPSSGADFGQRIAIAYGRALIASHSAVYIFQLQSNKWRQIGKLAFGRSVQVRDLDWHRNTAVVGASDSTGDAAYVFHYTNTNGTFLRVARIVAADARPSDRFGERVAVYGTTVAVTAPGYNSGQGAAYVFTCTETQCVEQQKLLANNGRPGDDFGHAIDLGKGVLVIGAPEANWVPGDPTQPPSETNHRAGGSAYLFVRSGSTWTEQQKLHPGPRQLNWYASFGYQVAVSATHVVIGAPYQVDNFDPGYVVDYRWSDGSLYAARAMINDVSHGEVLALYDTTLLAGIPAAPPYYGSALVYKLASQ